MALSTHRASSSRDWAEPPPQWNFDVFLSFRGEDTRTGFVSHLFRELQYRKVFKTFKDDRELEIGRVFRAFQVFCRLCQRASISSKNSGKFFTGGAKGLNNYRISHRMRT
ncbi:putative TIR domain-containing protein [Rosa chinensis]|uniref:Putative TIR domain-containing protein n=1 Tax=Rosa chinensis TaxID=74649 RepID=A0A2P6QIS8_ROSCH|nr:putative TIR domain-containing protein [Rosa chinensis]